MGVLDHRRTCPMNVVAALVPTLGYCSRAAHVCNHVMALWLQVLETYLTTLDSSADLTPVDRAEVGEIELYMATLLQESGDAQRALKVRICILACKVQMATTLPHATTRRLHSRCASPF